MNRKPRRLDFGPLPYVTAIDVAIAGVIARVAAGNYAPTLRKAAAFCEECGAGVASARARPDVAPGVCLCDACVDVLSLCCRGCGCRPVEGATRGCTEPSGCGVSQ